MVSESFIVKTLRIATRMSQLALWQAEHIKQKLIVLYPDLKVELLPFKTQGDKLLSVSLAKIGGKGLFVKELEEALMNHEADIAVHSVKDLPAQLPKELHLAAYCSREVPYDVLLSRQGESLLSLKTNPIIGTSSLRRQSQIKALREDCDCRLLRGNVPTRVEKLLKGEYDAIILAAAGLKRLNLDHHISQVFSLEEMLPAVGQGALGIECRAQDNEVIKLLEPLNEGSTSLCIQAERAMNSCLGGSCQVPIAGHAILTGSQMELVGRVGSLDGKTLLEAKVQKEASLAIEIGKEVAQQLLEQGARQLIDHILS